MKRSRELELMLNAYQAAKIPITTELREATRAGLLSIRRELYKDRQRAKQKRKDAHYRPGRAESGREIGYGLKAEKLGDPGASGNKIEQYLRSTGQLSADPDSEGGGEKMDWKEFIDSLDEKQLDALLEILNEKNDAIEAERGRAEEYRALFKKAQMLLPIASIVISAAAIVLCVLKLWII